ncbi:MAG TPA: hypothetical protein VMD74_04015 [Candidatus Methylomirabilis sp.]|nr:hypothetical protein [Candidatus Methylomirabilis sp.]
MSDQNNNQSLTFWQRQQAERLAKAKIKRNIAMYRRSGELGATAYEKSKTTFAGGEVESRSRVSLVGKTEKGVGRAAVAGVRDRLGFARATRGGPPSGFAKQERLSATGKSSSNLPNRPLGFK